MKSISSLLIRFLLTLTLTLLTGIPVQNCFASQNTDQNIDKIAVLPLTINSPNDLNYISRGVGRMLYSRLSWPGKVTVVPPRQIDSLMAKPGGSMPTDKQVSLIAEKTASNYVMAGSITQLAGSFSIDAKVFDIPNKRYMAFFEQSDKEDELIAKVDRIAAAINKKIFNRETVTWSLIEKEKQARIDDNKRKNPEYLMNTLPNGWQPQKKNHGWKIWKYIF